MDWLNYHHLLYFYLVAREGRLAKAAEILRLSPQAVLGQIRVLEERLGVELFVKQGRRLVPSEAGRRIYRLAEGIYDLGHQVVQVAAGENESVLLPLRMGVSDSIPKLVVRHLLETIWRDHPGLRIVVLEGDFARLLSELQLGDHDVVLTDGPSVPDPAHQPTNNYSVLRSDISFYATPSVAENARQAFPRSLDEMPLILPSARSLVRRLVNTWFQRHEIEPLVLVETDDSALMKVLGSDSQCAFPAPKAIESFVKKQFGAVRLGDLTGVEVEYFLVSKARETSHPALNALIEHLPLRLEDDPPKRRRAVRRSANTE